MSLSTDALLERIRLKSQLSKWRALTIMFAAALAIFWLGDGPDLVPGRDYIARVSVTGLLEEDRERDEVLKSLAEDGDVRAVIVHINTPGGTVVGGENLYNIIKELSKTKPTVSTMGTVATSAGYMVALGSERIFAKQGTITGSIGVILHSAEVIELAKKVGINFDIIKSGNLKAVPSPFEKLTPEARKVVQYAIDDFYKVFVNMVVEGRGLPEAKVKQLADGRIYTGNQALKNKLVDAIGGEDEAVDWLKENKGVKTDNVVEVELYKKKSGIEEIFSSLQGKNSLLPKMLSLQGLLSIWVDGIIY